ncbi:MAG: hypothetical protein JRI63_14285 [Deltaproteobacteria bacterium]|nr:hypothetical protein [Deltaproteobacteria bacterium]
MYTDDRRLIHEVLNFAEDSGYRSFSIGKFCYFHRHHPNNKSIHKTIMHLCSRNQLVKLSDGRFISSKKMNEIKVRTPDLPFWVKL